MFLLSARKSITPLAVPGLVIIAILSYCLMGPDVWTDRHPALLMTQQVVAVHRGTPMTISRDRKRAAFSEVTSDGKIRVTLDERAGKAYDSIEYGSFSPDSHHFAYIAKEGSKKLVVLDETEGKKYDGVSYIVFSPDSAHIAYEAVENGIAFGVLDKAEQRRFVDTRDGFVFSPDSKRLGYEIVDDNRRQIVVVDGVRQKPYEKIEPDMLGLWTRLVFSPDSKHFAFVAERNGKQFVVLDDGTEQPQYGHVGGPLLFSPDSKRIAYVASYDRKWLVVMDGHVVKEHLEDELPGNLAFSPDGSSIAYIVRHNSKYSVVMGSVVGAEYDDIWGAPVFSPDGRHLAYLAKRDGLWRLVVDGSETEPFDAEPSPLWITPLWTEQSTIEFDNPHIVRCLLQKEGLYRVGPFEKQIVLFTVEIR